MSPILVWLAPNRVAPDDKKSPSTKASNAPPTHIAINLPLLLMDESTAII